MAQLFECKACGGELDIIEDGIGRCTYCGCKQPIPKSNETLFNRANKLRLENKDFEEAYKVYQQILADTPDDPEVYWGMLLCRYGIEYVKDSNGEYLPTCHRTITTSITRDTDFLETLNHAEPSAFEYYKAQGVLIDTYQKKIKAIVANEKPYDVFISFKSTDEDGFPTQESILGQKIYNYLTKDLKLKVFFSNVTLQNRAGEEYEPIIFAALRSSKVMVLVGSNVDNVNSTWVKNEWSRYIRMVEEAKKEGTKKRLIPALINMKPEQLPSELSGFQAMDMSIPLSVDKLGNSIDAFIGDEKIKENNNISNVSEKTVSENLLTKQAQNALQFAIQKLQSGSFDEATNMCKQALSYDITLHQAYWGLLLASYKAKNDNEFVQLPIEHLEENMEFKNAINYAPKEKKEYYRSFVAKCARIYGIKTYQEKYDNDIATYYQAYENFNKDTNISQSSRIMMLSYFNELEQKDKIVGDYYSAKKGREDHSIGMLIGSVGVGGGSILLTNVIDWLACKFFKIDGLLSGLFSIVIVLVEIALWGVAAIAGLFFVYELITYFPSKNKFARKEREYENYVVRLKEKLTNIGKDSERELANYNSTFANNCQWKEEIRFISNDYISVKLFNNQNVNNIVNSQIENVIQLAKLKEEQERAQAGKAKEILNSIRKND